MSRYGYPLRAATSGGPVPSGRARPGPAEPEGLDTRRPHRPRPPARDRRAGSTGLGHLLSFEAAFVLFIYSNEIKIALPLPLPVDETVLFALAVGSGALVLWREGLCLRGLPVVGAACSSSPGRWRARLGRPRGFWSTRASPTCSPTMFCIVAGACIVAGRRERVVRLFALALASLMALYGLYIFAAYGDFRRWSGWEDIERRAYLAFGHTVANGAGIACVAIAARLGSVKQALGAMLFAAAVFLLVGGGRGPVPGRGAGGAGRSLAPVRRAPSAAGSSCRGTPRWPSSCWRSPLPTLPTWSPPAKMTTTLARFAKLASQAEDTTAVQGPNRFEYWAAAWRFWLQAPFLGHGLNSFSVLLRGGRELEGSHPHNIVLQILAELGLVGLFLFGLFVWLAARHASFRQLRHDPLMVRAALRHHLGDERALRPRHRRRAQVLPRPEPPCIAPARRCQ